MGLWRREKVRLPDAGPTATEASSIWHHRLKGRRYFVLGSPVSAINLAIGPLVAEGFALRVDDLEVALRREGSRWTGRTLDIGDAAMAKRLRQRNFWGRSLTIGLIWDAATRRGISPTLVAVVARPAADGHSELVISPVRSGQGPIEDAHAAEPRLARATAAVEAGFAGERRLLQPPEVFEPVTMDKQCPASSDYLKRLIDWPPKQVDPQQSLR
jgi:hypothetical protein